MEKIITFAGQPAKVGCDEKCNKAWGINNRPRIYVELGQDIIFGLNNTSIYPKNGGEIDVDDNALCSDNELSPSFRNECRTLAPPSTSNLVTPSAASCSSTDGSDVGSILKSFAPLWISVAALFSGSSL